MRGQRAKSNITGRRSGGHGRWSAGGDRGGTAPRQRAVRPVPAFHRRARDGDRRLSGLRVVLQRDRRAGARVRPLSGDGDVPTGAGWTDPGTGVRDRDARGADGTCRCRRSPTSRAAGAVRRAGWEYGHPRCGRGVRVGVPPAVEQHGRHGPHGADRRGVRDRPHRRRRLDGSRVGRPRDRPGATAVLRGGRGDARRGRRGRNLDRGGDPGRYRGGDGRDGDLLGRRRA